MTPFTYAFAQYDEPVYSQEVVEVSDDTANSQISGQATAGDSSSETWYEENIQGESPVDFSLNTESQTSAEDSQQAEQASTSSQNDGDANNNPGSVSVTDQDWNAEQNENVVEPGLNWAGDTQDVQNDEQEVEEELDFTGKTVAAVTKMLWGNWETDSDGYAEALGIENYQGYPEQNEIIRNYMVTNKTLPEKWQNTQDSSLRSEWQAWSEWDTQISDDEDGEDDEDPLPEDESGTPMDSSAEASEWQNWSEEWDDVEDEKWFFDELSDDVSDLFAKVKYFFTKEWTENYIIVKINVQKQ